MRNSIGRQATSYLCTLLMIVTPLFVTGSGCPGGMDPSGSTLVLSASSADPGQSITISSEAITPSITQNARFQTSDGYDVAVELLDVQEGSARVVVPPYLDPSTGDFGAREVTVSIDGVSGSQPLAIGDLPDLGNADPGELLLALLEVTIESYEETLANLDEIQAETGEAIDSSEAEADLLDIIGTLTELRDELQQTGQITVDLGDGETQVLSGEDLRTADRLILALFDPIADDSTAKSVRASRDIAECLDVPADQRVDCIKDVLNDIRRDTGRGTNLGSTLVTGAGLIVFVAGLVFTSEAIAVTGIIVTVIGAGSNYMNAAVNEQNTDAFLTNDGEGFNASKESASQAVRILSSAGSNLPGPPGLISKGVSFGTGVKDLVEGARSEKCRTNTQQALDQVILFCDLTDPDATDDETPDDGSDDGMDDGSDDSDDMPDEPSGAFTVLSYSNTDGTTGISADGAQITLSGSATAPTFSWSIPNVFVLFLVDQAGTPLYGIEGEREDEEGDIEQVPFAFSSVTYGDYSRTDTVPLIGASDSSPPLQSNTIHTVSVGTIDAAAVAILVFQVNP